MEAIGVGYQLNRDTVILEMGDGLVRYVFFQKDNNVFLIGFDGIYHFFV